MPSQSPVLLSGQDLRLQAEQGAGPVFTKPPIFLKSLY